MSAKRTTAISMAFVVVLFQILGCGSLRPQLTKRYAKRIPASALKKPQYRHYIAPTDPLYSVFAMAAPPSTSAPTVAALAERAQAALIQQLGSSLSAQELLKALQPQSPTASHLDLTQIKRRIVLSIENTSASPADRIDRTATTVEISNNPQEIKAEFSSWSLFATKHGTIDLGAVKANQSRETSFGVKLTPPQIQEVVEATAGRKSTRALEEVLSLQQRFVESTGALTPTSARLIQQGAPGLDLTGNIAIDLTVKVGDDDQVASLETFFISKLFDKDGKPTPQEDVVVRRDVLTYVDHSHCRPILATASFSTIVRSVVRGEATYMEGDDVALYLTTIPAPLHFTLVPVEALRASLWTLRSLKTGHAIGIMKHDGGVGTLFLPNASDAAAVLQYLSTAQPGSKLAIDGMGLTLADKPLVREDVPSLSSYHQKLNWGDGSKCAGK